MFALCPGTCLTTSIEDLSRHCYMHTAKMSLSQNYNVIPNIAWVPNASRSETEMIRDSQYICSKIENHFDPCIASYENDIQPSEAISADFVLHVEV